MSVTTVPTRLGVDVGGTFTDLVALVDGVIHASKVPSTPDDQSVGVMDALETLPVDRAQIVAFAHGMTVATNALLERRGARTALVTTHGFRDVIEIGRQNRPRLYDLAADRPPALIPRELRFTVRERTGPHGILEPLDEDSLRAAVEAVRRAGVEAVAVCLLFAFAHPEHERRVAAALRSALPDLHVSLSSEVLPEAREYERLATTAADAYLAPVLSRYLARLADRARAARIPTPLVMQSSGGVADVELAARQASTCVLSGPAGGVVGAAYVAAASGFANVLTFDMGGTSTDVAAVVDGRVQTRTESVVAGVPIRHPMVDVHTVSAGGGSVAWADAGGALRVGPRSAGARPGPACYGNGGVDPTVTDADLLLGYLADGARLGGTVVLDREPAQAAIGRLGRRIGLDPLAAALGIVRVANTEMVRALRVISVEQGLDPRGFALMAFGGAGGMHACALAEELGIATVLVPRAGGMLSALGLAVSDVRQDYVRACFADLDDGARDDVERRFREIERRAAAALDAPTLSRYADLRYRGQSFELTVPADDLGRLAERFHAAHERHHGYAMPEEPVELVALRVTASSPVDAPQLAEAPSARAAEPRRRKANFDGEWIDVDVRERERMGLRSPIEGPAIVELAGATCVVRPGWKGAIDGAGTLVLRRT